MRLLFFIVLLISMQFSATSQIGRLALSPVQTITQELAKTTITLKFSRPAMRGRTIFGSLVPYGERWRTGANRNTWIEFSKSVKINDKDIVAGRYAIFSLPQKDKWTVYFYENSENWNVPANWQDSLVVAQIDVPTSRLNERAESFSIAIDQPTNDGFDLRIYWENTHVSIPIELSTEKELTDIITDVLDGPDADDYFLAAQYRGESGRDLEQGLAWINKAIEIRPTSEWFDLMVKGDILIKMKRYKEAKEVAEKGMTIAQKEDSSFGKRRLKRILKAIPK